MDGFAALADPTRRRIVEALAHGPLSSGEIVGLFTVSAPAISQHLRTLREARLVRSRPQAQRRIYELDEAGIGEVGAWIDDLRGFWAGRFDRLESALGGAV